MDHIQRKNKLKSYFETLKGHAWKLRRREKKKKKIIDVKLEMR